MGFSREQKRNLLDYWFNKSTFVKPTNFYIGLSLTQPTSTGGNIIEPTDVAYLRQAFVQADWDATIDEDPVAITNNKGLTFPQASEDWFAGQDIPYIVIFDQQSGGTMLMYGSYARAKPVYSGDILSIEISKLLISLV